MLRRHAVRELVWGIAQAEEQRKIVLAVDEACANIIRHTYHGDPVTLLERPRQAWP